jgi:hypothetical protein
MSRLQAVPAFAATVPNVSPKTRGRVCVVDKAKILCVPGVPTFFEYPPLYTQIPRLWCPYSPLWTETFLLRLRAPLKVGDTGDRGMLDRKTRMNKPYFRRHVSPAKRGHAGGILLALGDMKDRSSRRRSIIGSDRIPFVAPRTLEGKILEESANRAPGGFTL